MWFHLYSIMLIDIWASAQNQALEERKLRTRDLQPIVRVRFVKRSNQISSRPRPFFKSQRCWLITNKCIFLLLVVEQNQRKVQRMHFHIEQNAGGVGPAARKPHHHRQEEEQTLPVCSLQLFHQIQQHQHHQQQQQLLQRKREQQHERQLLLGAEREQPRCVHVALLGIQRRRWRRRIIRHRGLQHHAQGHARSEHIRIVNSSILPRIVFIKFQRKSLTTSVHWLTDLSRRRTRPSWSRAWSASCVARCPARRTTSTAAIRRSSLLSEAVAFSLVVIIIITNTTATTRRRHRSTTRADDWWAASRATIVKRPTASSRRAAPTCSPRRRQI